MSILKYFVAAAALLKSIQAQLDPEFHFVNASGLACQRGRGTGGNATHFEFLIADFHNNLETIDAWEEDWEYYTHDHGNCTAFYNVTFNEPGQTLAMTPESVIGHAEVSTHDTVTVRVTHEWVETGQGTTRSVTISNGHFGRFDKQLVSNSSSDTATSPCNGGLLKVLYQLDEIERYSNAPGLPVIWNQVWYFTSSLAVGTCQA
ncbi:hypothetical protein BS50DRAFT_627855 [Corynespora cassiicola Philippines]|uniref:Ecp2 effector protein domain-containing protein n=1 Tax=Corynespora cassiicola Philippines TaxID=1448308 RepID=A0A2T2PA74_CORCC|nr:hypothetical protein BS50DRAFT_627855 [Corynespora cassiicola Philippines]